MKSKNKWQVIIAILAITFFVSINAKAQCNADFSYTYITNDSIAFTDLTTCSSGYSIIMWDWDFDDGSTSSFQNPTHSFQDCGSYDVMLIAIADSAGYIDRDTITQTVIINPGVDFTYNGVCIGSMTQFDVDTVIININDVVSFSWSFGDGTTSNLQNPSHIYANTGNYSVTLTIVNTDGCTADTTHIININSLPNTDFTFEETCFNEPVLFTDLSSTNGGSDILSWEWEFGDPNSGSDSISYLQNPTHVYTEPDTYTTSLTITNMDGCTDTSWQEIIVDSLPTVDFTMVDDSICLGEIAVFNGISTNNISIWYWDFGDGATAIGQNPNYMYSAPGTYLVTLTVTDAGFDECQNSINYNIYVGDAPTVDFGYNITSLGDSTFFYDLSISLNGPVTNWEWNFDDGNTSTTQNPVHLFQSTGIYNVSLSIVDNIGCTNTNTNQVEVYPPPVFPDSNAIWNTIGHNSLTNEDWRFRYGMIGDTTISIRDTSYTYSKVYSLYDSTLTNPNSTYFGAIRTTEDNKVYFKLPDLPETILYDYSAEIGDTLWFNIGGGLCNDGVSFREHDHYKVVAEKDSVLLLDNQYHTRWLLDGFLNDIWIEGFGSIVWYGLFNPIISDIALCGDSYSFACFKENNIPLYINNPDCNNCFCYLLTTIDDQLDVTTNINIFPNPAKDIINISIYDQQSDEYEIQIFNSLGQNVYIKSHMKSYGNNINLLGWTKGLYVMKIKNGNTLIGITKFIIE